MAIWNRNKVPPANLNAGQQYTAEDWTSEQTFNAANNNAFYAVDYAEALGDTPDTSEVGNIGTPTVTLIDNVKIIDGVSKTFKKFKFSNLKGEQGDSPIKGVDYWTEADKGEIIQAVVDIMGGSLIGYVDENNVIVLVGGLEGETYTVKYKMEDESLIDIGELKFAFAVTNNLTNCTNSNSETSVVNGGAYSATISANSGYTISSITVTMGGVDITSTAVSGGNINIASVTGDIVITAVAEEIVIINQIPISTDASGNPFVGTNGEAGYKTGYRLSLSSGGETAASDYECTGFIPAVLNDIIRIKNIDITEENSTNIIFYDSSKNPIVCSETRYGIPLALFFATAEGNGVYSGTIEGTISTWTAPSNTAFIRIGSKSITADSILTVNEAIV
jgi:hypothetical protein